jgi:AMMECR1 domain-containing protein
LIEISLLTIPKKTTYDKIKKGDGVILNQGFYSALFLPQVWDQLPEKDVFMSQLCLKAGLSSNCYLEPKTAFKRFTVEAWKEEMPGGNITLV